MGGEVMSWLHRPSTAGDPQLPDDGAAGSPRMLRGSRTLPRAPALETEALLPTSRRQAAPRPSAFPTHLPPPAPPHRQRQQVPGQAPPTRALPPLGAPASTAQSGMNSANRHLLAKRFP